MTCEHRRNHHHILPYHPSQIGLSEDHWMKAMVSRWPIAAAARCVDDANVTVHYISSVRFRRSSVHGGVEFMPHYTYRSGPALRPWGTEWSYSLGRTLRDLEEKDVVFAHCNATLAARRIALNISSTALLVTVLHGMGANLSSEEMRRADRILTIRQDHADNLTDPKAGTAGRSVLITPSVDRLLLRSRAKPSSERHALGFIGRIEHAKGVDRLIEIAESLHARRHGTVINCIGPKMSTGSTDRELIDQFEDLEDRGLIKHYGQLGSSDVATHLGSWKVLVVPSRTEGFPLVALEALAAGCNVVGLHGVLPTNLTDLPGVFACNSTAEMADEVLSILERPSDQLAVTVPDHQSGATTFLDIADRRRTQQQLTSFRTRSDVRLGLAMIMQDKTMRPIAAALRFAVKPRPLLLCQDPWRPSGSEAARCARHK